MRMMTVRGPLTALYGLLTLSIYSRKGDEKARSAGDAAVQEQQGTWREARWVEAEGKV